jgi:hypothetical protein
MIEVKEIFIEEALNVYENLLHNIITYEEAHCWAWK